MTCDISLSTDNLSYLLIQICKAHRRVAEEQLNTIGLHAGQEMLLLQLQHMDGRVQIELADDLCIQPATLTRSLDRLERNGLIARHPDPADRRVSRVFLTPEGRNVITAVQRVWRELEERTFANLTGDERMLLRRLLLQLNTNLQE